MTEIGTVLEGKYEILKKIGSGGMSTVFLAMDNRLNKQWAVKEIKKKGNGKNDEMVVNSLLAEANMMKRLDHPALPRIVDIIDKGYTIFIVMDYIEGESLDKVLLEYGAQPEEYVIQWAKELANALDYLHSQTPPIIYRDMKPANVMLKPEGNIKIIDFGIAREYKEQNLADTTVLGTKGYAPPEQYSGQTDPRSDIYALGMTMHHLLTGVDPRKGEAYASVRQWNPALSEGIEAIIDKCVQPAPENRYQNCQDLIYDLCHPEAVGKKYKQKQKKRLNLFKMTTAFTILMLVAGIGCNVAARSINNSTYDALLDTVDSVENYKEAIEIYPEKTDGYMRMLEYYEGKGVFGPEESKELLAVYNINKDRLDKTSTEVAVLNYKIGLMYFNYYTDSDGDNAISERIQKAYPFFDENFRNRDKIKNFDEMAISDCYYQICSFYKKYIFNAATVEEASSNDFDELLTLLKETADSIENAGAYDKLTLYNGIFMLIYDQRVNLATVKYDQNKIYSLLEDIRINSENINANKIQSQKLKEEIMGNYNSYKEAVARAYENAVERGNRDNG